MYDNSLSTLYTLCDGKTIAGIEDIGKTMACEVGGGETEPGHIAKNHCLNATSRNGFLTGSDTARSLDDEYRCFNPNGLKYRSYFYDWDGGHRYILNLRENEVYTRHYASLGKTPEFYVPNDGNDPDAKAHFNQRGNGTRTFKPALTAEALPRLAHLLSGVRANAPAGVEPTKAGELGEVTFKIEGANVITSLAIAADFVRQHAGDLNAIAVSTTNGLRWADVWKNEGTGVGSANLQLTSEVNGAGRGTSFA